MSMGPIVLAGTALRANAETPRLRPRAPQAVAGAIDGSRNQAATAARPTLHSRCPLPVR